MRLFYSCALFGILSFSLISKSDVKFSYEPPEGYKKKSVFFLPGDVWMKPAEKKPVITVLTKEKGYPPYLSKNRIKEYSKEIEDDRRIIHSVFGYKDWNVQNSKYEKQGKWEIAKLKGSYRNLKEKLVQFAEWHFHKGQKFLAISYTEESPKPIDDNYIAKTLGSLRPL
jgi:hypothetical protein